MACPDESTCNRFIQRCTHNVIKRTCKEMYSRWEIDPSAFLLDDLIKGPYSLIQLARYVCTLYSQIGIQTCTEACIAQGRKNLLSIFIFSVNGKSGNSISQSQTSMRAFHPISDEHARMLCLIIDFQLSVFQGGLYLT